MVYVASGKGMYEGSGREPVSLDAGTLMLLFPDEWHRYKPLPETGWEEFWVGILLFADIQEKDGCAPSEYRKQK